MSAAFGFALFWISQEETTSYLSRLWMGTLWFTAVQLIQLSWALSHPYLYIYPIWIAVSFLFGLQFGFVNGWMKKRRALRVSWCLLFSSLWMISEWLRLFILSGLSWNPIGLALSGWVITLQVASIAGVFGMSFLVFFTNTLLYRLYLLYRQGFSLRTPALTYLSVLGFPYIFGAGHLMIHLPKLEQAGIDKPMVNVLLVQTAFSVNEVIDLKDPLSTLSYTFSKWKRILGILKEKQEHKLDLIVFPEYVVPYGTYYPVFPLSSVQLEFRKAFGESILKTLPEKEMHLAAPIETESGNFWMVNNAYWMQGISNIFDAEIVAGLEDTEDFFDKPSETYVSAMIFFPKSNHIERYEKRVLVPLGEYIPFEFCRNMARNYGVASSFTPGKKAKVIAGRCVPYGLSICYEETYGHLMRDNRLDGAEMLVNITNDFWYPNSRLPKQHFDHARLRAVEMGIPLVRSANTGVTGAFNCLGEIIGTLGLDADSPEDVSDALFVRIPRYSYSTIYTYTGDLLPLSLAWGVLLYFLVAGRFGQSKN
jgi:apolipoprotein N-acyltransferase